MRCDTASHVSIILRRSLCVWIPRCQLGKLDGNKNRFLAFCVHWQEVVRWIADEKILRRRSWEDFYTKSDRYQRKALHTEVRCHVEVGWHVEWSHTFSFTEVTIIMECRPAVGLSPTTTVTTRRSGVTVLVRSVFHPRFSKLNVWRMAGAGFESELEEKFYFWIAGIFLDDLKTLWRDKIRMAKISSLYITQRAFDFGWCRLHIYVI
jgi:hypothetical protein